MNTADYIHIAGLSHRYRGAAEAALDNIELHIPRGCSFGLLGPNGAGKTTLLSILTGLLPVQTGSVQIAGHDIQQQASQIKAISALVPQDYAFYLALTGHENLRFFANVYGLSRQQWRERLAYVVEVCRLQDMLKQRVAHYSGGMKRRLNMAIGLLNNPQLLYLDEPTVGIDAQSRQVIIAAIQALRVHGTTVIYTSHYMEEVEAICDEVAVINHGKVVARDRTAQLLQQAAGKSLLLTFAIEPSAALLNALQVWQVQRVQQCHYELTLRAVGEVNAVLDICQQHAHEVMQLQFGISKLERIYLSLLQANEALA